MVAAANPSTAYVAHDARKVVDLYKVTGADLGRIQAYGRLVLPKLDQYIDQFYKWLEGQSDYPRFFSDPKRLKRAQDAQRKYWKDFFGGVIDGEYLERRKRIGETHARIGLSLQSYFSAMNFSLTILTEDLYDGSLTAEEYAATVSGIARLLHLDTSLVVESFSQMTNETLTAQSRAMMEMSTPVTALWDDVLMLPVVGIIDSKRAQDIMSAMLERISESRATQIILDISGVGVVDTAVANHLIKITKATRLMGCNCTISGVSPAIAQTVVELGIEVGDVRTTATLQDALAEAFRASGIDLMRTPKSR